MNQLDKKIINSFNQDAPLGLFAGKTGFCLYAFWLSRVNQNKAYQKTAEVLLDVIMDKAADYRVVDLMNGLAGIGLVLSYLIKESYVKGNPNTILSDLDDVIFKHLSYPVYLDNLNTLSVIHILFYLTLRASDQKHGGEQEYLYQELIITTVNHIYQKADSEFFEEQQPFSIYYKLPQFLFVLSRIYKLGFYNCRIVKILEEIGTKTCSMLPTLHANRLFLMWGMDSVEEQAPIKGWDSHVRILRENLDMNLLLDDELRSRNIFIDGGYSGIYLLLTALQKYFSKGEVQQWTTKIINKIEQSDIWALAERDQDFFINNRGLITGLCGVSMVLSDTKSKYLQI
ncbi:MAG: hypothetical protein LBC84_08450 [Prevotellaceae bacterium]|jgi:hypothetical protein|nr:hypothetical protein [Prevotellaceae bacterium]